MEFRKMRRSRQQLTKSECDAILSKTTSGTLALLGDNGYPYAVPISYVYADGRLYFHSAQMGHKVDAIRRYDKASFCVIAADDVQPSEFTTYFRSVIAFGKIQIIESESERMYPCWVRDTIPVMTQDCKKSWKKVCRTCLFSVSTLSI